MVRNSSCNWSEVILGLLPGPVYLLLVLICQLLKVLVSIYKLILHLLPLFCWNRPWIPSQLLFFTLLVYWFCWLLLLLALLGKSFFSLPLQLPDLPLQEIILPFQCIDFLIIVLLWILVYNLSNDFLILLEFIVLLFEECDEFIIILGLFKEDALFLFKIGLAVLHLILKDDFAGVQGLDFVLKHVIVRSKSLHLHFQILQLLPLVVSQGGAPLGGSEWIVLPLGSLHLCKSTHMRNIHPVIRQFFLKLFNSIFQFLYFLLSTFPPILLCQCMIDVEILAQFPGNKTVCLV